MQKRSKNNNRPYSTQIRAMDTDPFTYKLDIWKRKREADLLEVLGSDAGKIEAVGDMDQNQKECGDREWTDGERSSKRHGVSLQKEREREWKIEREQRPREKVGGGLRGGTN